MASILHRIEIKCAGCGCLCVLKSLLYRLFTCGTDGSRLTQENFASPEGAIELRRRGKKFETRVGSRRVCAQAALERN